MPAAPPHPVRITSLIDTLPVAGWILRVPVLCVLLMLTEGIDTFGVGFVGPFISARHGISAQELGVVYGGSVVASLLGATLLAPLSDRFGRRPLLLLTSLLMAPATLLTPLAPNLFLLFALRFLIGLGFGAALPCAIALIGDYAPARRRSLLLLMMNTGINVGMMLAGIGAAFIIPAAGWQMLLYVGGALSLAITAAAWFVLPESLQYLARRDPRSPEGMRILRRLGYGTSGSTMLEAERPSATAGSPVALLRDGRLPQTMLLWALMSFNYVMINFGGYWLPTAILETGADIHQAGLLVSTGRACGIAGALVVGFVADRRGLPPVLALSYALTGAATILTGGLAALPVAAIALTFAAFLLNPVTGGTQALVLNSYPPELHGVATGWISGFARLIGGGAGTLVGGIMIGKHWTPQAMGLVLGSGLLLASIGPLVVARGLQRPG